MNYSEMVGQLKSTMPDDYTTGTTGMLLELMQCLQERFKKQPDDTLNDLAQQMRSHLVGCAQREFSVQRYFTGDGPIARKLKDYAVISKMFSIGSFKLEDKLKQFDFKPVQDVERGQVFRDWLQQVALNAFAEKHPFAVPSPYHEGIEIGLDTGVHTQQITYQPGVEPARYMVLAVELKNGMKVKYVVERNKHAMLLYYHPHEEVWLADNGINIFEGVQEALAVEWEKMANECGYTDRPIDFEAEMENIQIKVNHIFDHEDQLPETLQHYARIDKGMSSYMQFNLEEYVLSFMNTKGQWASRCTTLMIQGGQFNTKVEFSQLREFARQELIKFVNAGLDEIIHQYLQPGEVGDAEAAEEAAKVPGIGEGEIAAPVEASGVPNYNPVWRAMQATKKKEEK